MMEEGQAGTMEEGQASMEEGQASMEEGQASMEEGEASCVLQAKAAGFKSTVADLIDFKPTENPKWRTAEDLNIPDVQGMIKQIAEYHREWRNLKSTACVSEITADLVYQFIYHCNLEGKHGCGTFEDTKNCLKENTNDGTWAKEEQETINLKSAYLYLQDIIEDESQEEVHGLIEESMLRTLNKIILRDIKLHKDATEPGNYSKQRRRAEYEGEKYWYPKPDDMHNDVNTILDRFNSLYKDAQKESDDEKKLEKLFKASSFFLFEMLALHPFGDGNGRVCRLLCNYVLSTCTPFPSPVYNSYSKSSKDDYMQAVVEARKSKDRHPCSLTTMIIECNYTTWEKFIQRIKINI